jgi:hypothetical protein
MKPPSWYWNPSRLFARRRNVQYCNPPPKSESARLAKRNLFYMGGLRGTLRMDKGERLVTDAMRKKRYRTRIRTQHRVRKSATGLAPNEPEVAQVLTTVAQYKLRLATLQYIVSVWWPLALIRATERRCVLYTLSDSTSTLTIPFSLRPPKITISLKHTGATSSRATLPSQTPVSIDIHACISAPSIANLLPNA